MARRVSSASPSQVRRSSRASSKHSAGSRPNTRGSSNANQYTDIGFGDPDLNDLSWINNADNWDATADGNLDFGFWAPDYDPALDAFSHNKLGYPFDPMGFETTARRTDSLVLNPLSAIPGTPQVMNFNNALQEHNAPLLPTKENDASMPALTYPAGWLSGAQNPPLQGDWFSLVGDGQTYAYADPVQPLNGAELQPYCGNGLQQYQDHYGLAQIPEEPLEIEATGKRRRSQTPGSAEVVTPSKSHFKRTRNLRHSSTHSSETSYANRSARSSAEEYMRAPTALEVPALDNTKRRSVVAQRNIAKGQVPKLDSEKPWIRINKTTRGESTRTAKVNDFDPSTVYNARPHPLGNWDSGRYKFKYTAHGEWKEQKLPAAAIRDFILRYPENEAAGIKLKLFIQITPTDSARRYLTQSWTKCRFAECPMHQNGGTGTILHGHYRIAFDERSFGSSHKDPYDPHLAAGAYVHLYCFERFLDLEYICRKAHIHVDNRTMHKEPRGRFAASLAGHPEYEPAREFIAAAMEGVDVRKIEGFENYPRHKDYKGAPKPHELTLVHKMHEIRSLARPPAQLKQFQSRGLGPTHLLFNHGDLELYLEATLFEKTQKMKQKKLSKSTKGNKRKIQEVTSEDEDEYQTRMGFEDKVRRLTANIEQKYNLTPLTDNQEAALQEAKTNRWKRKAQNQVNKPADDLEDDSDSDAPPRKRMRTKRKSPTGPQPWENDDSDSDANFNAARQASVQGSRRSARAATRQRKNYREIEDPPVLQPHQVETLQNFAGFAPAAQDLPINPFEAAQQQHGIYQQRLPSPQARRDSLPPFTDPALEGLDFDALFAQEGLNRRNSSITGRRASSAASLRRLSILRSAMSPSTSRTSRGSRGSRTSSLGTKRHASFSTQPVSHQQEFDTDAPPREVETPSSPPRRHKGLHGVRDGRVGKNQSTCRIPDSRLCDRKRH